MKTENRAFLEMLKPAKERLSGRSAKEIAENTQIEFREDTQTFHLSSLGKEILVHYPEYDMTPEMDEWHCLLLLHYMDLADGTLPGSSSITFGGLKNGMVRGGGLTDNVRIQSETSLEKRDPQKVRKACEELGADIVPSKADLCAVFSFFPLYPVTLNIWFADEEFEASGRMLLNASVDHYLTVEDAVTVGSLVLEELVQKLSHSGQEKE